MTDLPPYAAVVLAGGKAVRLGGQPKPQLAVGGRTMLAAVLAAVPTAVPRVVVGPPQPVPDGVVLVREVPPRGGPVPALRAGLAAVGTEVVAVLAADLPFLTAALVDELRGLLTDADGVLVVDGSGRDQLLLGVWRTAPLRAALAGVVGPTSMRALLAPLSIHRHRPATGSGPAPWTDCDTPAELARARSLAGPDGSPRG